jgi:hypothetical protein
MLILTIFRKKEYRRREPFVYLAIIITMSFIDILAYYILPTAPPVRLNPELFYTILIFPEGDSWIAIKYNAIP